MFAAAKAADRFVMEAFWSRFLPVYAQVRRWLDEGRVGKVTGIESFFGYAQPRNLDDRLFRADLAGGALLDVGIYCISMSHHLFKGPLRVLETSATVGATGVDEDLRARIAVGDQAVELRMHASMTQKFYNSFRIEGEEGEILVTEPFWDSGQAILLRRGEAPVASHAPYAVNGFEYQVREVQRCMQAGPAAERRGALGRHARGAALHGRDPGGRGGALPVRVSGRRVRGGGRNRAQTLIYFDRRTNIHSPQRKGEHVPRHRPRHLRGETPAAGRHRRDRRVGRRAARHRPARIRAGASRIPRPGGPPP